MTPKFFDAHTHLNMIGVDPGQGESSWQTIGKRTLEAGISFVNVGADEKSSILALEQIKYLKGACLPAEAYAQAGATVGIHPTETEDSNFEIIAELARDEKVVAIGECGLEYFKLPDSSRGSLVAKQKELFIKHIDLALKVGKPLMIHCRSSEQSTDAYDDILEILREYKKSVGDKLKFNMHFFTSDWVTAQKFFELDGYLSFPGVITFTTQYDDIVKNAPLDRIMAETDAPFATPVPFRGKQNEPAYVSYVAEHIAKLRPESPDLVLRALVTNAKRFYGLS